jgi:hypothetical protein
MEERPAMHSRTVTLMTVLAGLALAACGSPQTTPSTSGTTASSATPPIIGEWQRLTTCQERVAAMTKAGLTKYAAESVAGDGFIPGVSSASDLKDPEHPCAGAVSMKHSHFFTADGRFGSRDEQGQQVDDDAYQLVDGSTIQIGDVVFHFTITDGATLRLMPVMPACASQGCFEAQWAVAVSYLGLPWTRIGP